MKESDYILATDIARVQCVQALLREIVPDMTPHIPSHEVVRVQRILKLWGLRLHVASGSADAKAKGELRDWETAWSEDKGHSPQPKGG